ncbi:MAG: MFS transporter [Candidatus Thorarchaeota archaeon]|nr:MFS transporter [Candidatus Thorarchaeota archaeon]
MNVSETPASMQVRPTRYIIFLVVVMGLVSNMDSWLSLIEATAFPLAIAEFGLTAENFALWQGAFGIIVFGVFFIGWFADAFGRRKGMMLLTVVMGIPTILIVYLSTDVFIFLLLYSIVIMGTTSNLWEVPVSEEAPAEKRGLYGSLAFLIGVIPLYAILGNRIIYATDWRWGYGVMFFLMIVLLVLLFFMKDPQRWTDSHEARGKKLGVVEALKKLNRADYKYIAIATVVYLAWTISFKIATSWGGYFFTTIQGMSPDEWTSLLTVAGLLLPVSALISGVLLDKGGRNIVLILGSLGSAICYIGLGLMQISYFYWGMFFFMAMVLAWIYVYLAEIFPTEIRSTSIGVCVTGARLGYVVGPLFASALLTAFPLMDMFWVIAGILMIVPLLAFIGKPLETKGKTLEEIEVER